MIDSRLAVTMNRIATQGINWINPSEMLVLLLPASRLDG